MKLLVIGSGGREHALLWKLRQSPRVTELYAAPGNAGTEEIATNIPIAADDIEGLLQWAREKKIDFTIVGPDDPLAAGIVDAFQKAGMKIFGPSAAGAQLESSKSFTKDFLKRHHIPTATSQTFTESAAAHQYAAAANYPLVIKADGLALGKGVVIANTPAEAAKAIDRAMVEKVFGDAGKTIVIEEFLQGPECSLHALIDGKSYLLFPDAQDHKQIFDGNQGPNTGGMGTISPSNVLSEETSPRLVSEILDPFLQGLADDNIPFKGLLFPGLIITELGPKVIEFNCRFGDPETQVLMRRLQSDLLDLLEATVDGRLAEYQPVWDTRVAVCIVLASGGYPGPVQKGKAIEGMTAAANSDSDVIIFHAGTKKEKDTLITSGGRVLGVTALGETFEEARKKAYAAAELITFEGKQLRSDIGTCH